MNITDQGENDKWDDNKYTMEDFIAERTANLSRGIVATPTEDYLEEFTKANNGSNDFLLMQMAKQYGYSLCMKHLREDYDNKIK